MRIAIDIDSTLHHYWDVLSRAAQRRFGIELPYEEQVTWGISRLRPEQLELCIAETHSAEQVLAGRPYPNAVEAVGRWHAAGHFIHITSHRTPGAHPATERWLASIGLAYHELYCSTDKVARCRELGIDVLIDDSPVNLVRASEHGILPATILHPWNRDLCEEEELVWARDWFELERKLAPVLGLAEDPPEPADAPAKHGSGPAATPAGEPPSAQERPGSGRARRPRPASNRTREAISRARAAVRRRAA